MVAKPKNYGADKQHSYKKLFKLTEFFKEISSNLTNIFVKYYKLSNFPIISLNFCKIFQFQSIFF